MYHDNERDTFLIFFERRSFILKVVYIRVTIRVLINKKLISDI